MSHDINWWTSSVPITLQTPGSALDPDFAPGVSSSVGMQHIHDDLLRLEGYLDSHVGTHHEPPMQDKESDGLAGDGCIYGYNFRSNGITDTITLRSTDTFTIWTEPNLDYGAGTDGAPFPGGTLRFHVWDTPVAVWVYYSATIVSFGADAEQTGVPPASRQPDAAFQDWELASRLNGRTQSRTRLRVANLYRGQGPNQVCTSWAISDPAELAKMGERGWNVVSNHAREYQRGICLVTSGTELIVVVAYR